MVKMSTTVFEHISPCIIAIDGPAGAGKSTISKRLADEFGICYLDTGAMYRAAAYLRLTLNLGENDEQALVAVLERATLDIEQAEKGIRVILNDSDITDIIRTPEMSREASRVSAWSGVRKRLVAIQRQLGEKGCFVVEGRDIGSVVFPNTPFKFYLDASVEERARRRKKQLEEKGVIVPLAQIQADIIQRDLQDSTRSDSPLMRADDAIYIDSSNLDMNQVIFLLRDKIKEIAKKVHKGEKIIENYT